MTIDIFNNLTSSYPIHSKNKLFISFSGGKTSAFMTLKLLNSPLIARFFSDIEVLFANTGQEHEETLKFINEFSIYYNIKVTWIESDLQSAKGWKVVDFLSADRTGSPFYSMCEKFGIPNQTGPFCTRELKLVPMTKYLRSIGWKSGTYVTAIGIRFDELDRISKNALTSDFWYPLIDIKITKKDILEFFKISAIKLNIPEHLGNCVWCWKKSDRKLFTIALQHPEYFDLPILLEDVYKNSGNFSKKEDRVFFRNYRSGRDLIKEALEKDFELFTDSYFVTMNNYDETLDKGGSCSEGCEID